MANSTAEKFWLEGDNPRRYFDTLQEAADYAEMVNTNEPWVHQDPESGGEYVILSGSVVTFS